MRWKSYPDKNYFSIEFEKMPFYVQINVPQYVEVCAFIS